MTSLLIKNARIVNEGREFEGDLRVRGDRIDQIGTGLSARDGETVRDARGNRLPGAKVTVQAEGGTGPSAEGTTDAQGEFRIRDAPTGELSVTAVRGDERGSIRVTVRPGDEILSLSLELR